ncbi:helix-turn-helix domain-containing protein [Streptomyces sp. NBC_01185]|uniref:helix-turn-helix domain-containing protein n=1 Tax=Streptomyces sp. NBC_01185 TaxID=2903764 RepID=UPI0038709876|nr:helix-turn-helix domain-containing protein [Streptomyces sp. NBC_01185]
MGTAKGIGPEAAAYATALRAVVHGFTGRGGTQREIADSVHVSQAALSRYLSGERIAPRSFIAALEAFLAREARPLGAEVRARLDELCGLAHQASRSPAVQLAYLKGELARVQAKKNAGEAELAALQEHADQLEQALRQARRSEEERRALEERVAGQANSLQHAETYTRQLQAELTTLQEQVVLIQREVKVLRRQNNILVEEEGTAAPGSGPQVETAVSGVSTQATGAGGGPAPSPGGTFAHGNKERGTSPSQTSAYTVSWTGDEDPRTFTKNGLAIPGSLLLVAALAVLYTAIEGSAKDNPAWAYTSSLIFLVGGAVLCGDMIPADKAKSAIPARTLSLDTCGLTASDTYGIQHFARTSIKKISIHHISERINSRTPLALHLQLHWWSPDAHRKSGPPAEWPLEQDPPDACNRQPHTSPDTWVPVCVLGPLTEPDRTDLKNALALHLKRRIEGIPVPALPRLRLVSGRTRT